MFIKRNLYAENLFNLDVDESINLLNDFEEMRELYENLESDSSSLNFRDYILRLLDDRYSNYSLNTKEKKFITNFYGEYLRDCLFEESCISAKTIIDMDKSSRFNQETISVLQNNYSYDNIRTRNTLVIPDLVKNSTEFQVLKPEEKINVVGLLLIPARLSYSNFNMNLYDSLFSLEEIRFYHYFNYSYELFKNIFNNEDVVSNVIDIDTRKVNEYSDDLQCYMFHNNVNDIDDLSMGNIMKENLPSHSVY